MRTLPIAAILFVLLSLSITACSAPKVTSRSEPISHDIWDSLLQEYVDDDGLVDYAAWQKDTQRLQNYLDLLRESYPNDRNWSRDEQMAYWINAYNAFTVELILDHYPVNSIKDIKDGVPFVNTVWDIKFITIEGEEFDLNNIEHGILRKEWEDDPRFHFALVCASMSCPKLQNRAFTSARLDQQLNAAAKEFLTEPFRNEISANQLRLSKLLDWYWGDFKDLYENRTALIEKYTDLDIEPGAEVSFLEYDWSLNEQTEAKSNMLRE